MAHRKFLTLVLFVSNSKGTCPCDDKNHHYAAFPIMDHFMDNNISQARQGSFCQLKNYPYPLNSFSASPAPFAALVWSILSSCLP
jgi:hypothetical protein